MFIWNLLSVVFLRLVDIPLCVCSLVVGEHAVDCNKDYLGETTKLPCWAGLGYQDKVVNIHLEELDGSDCVGNCFLWFNARLHPFWSKGVLAKEQSLSDIKGYFYYMVNVGGGLWQAHLDMRWENNKFEGSFYTQDDVYKVWPLFVWDHHSPEANWQVYFYQYDRHICWIIIVKFQDLGENFLDAPDCFLWSQLFDVIVDEDLERFLLFPFFVRPSGAVH